MSAPPEKFAVAIATLPSGATAKASPTNVSGVRVNPAGGIHAARETEPNRTPMTMTKPKAGLARIGCSFPRADPSRVAAARKKKNLGLAVPQAVREGRAEGQAAMR